MNPYDKKQKVRWYSRFFSTKPVATFNDHIQGFNKARFEGSYSEATIEKDEGNLEIFFRPLLDRSMKDISIDEIIEYYQARMERYAHKPSGMNTYKNSFARFAHYLAANDVITASEFFKMLEGGQITFSLRKPWKRNAKATNSEKLHFFKEEVKKEPEFKEEVKKEPEVEQDTIVYATSGGITIGIETDKKKLKKSHFEREKNKIIELLKYKNTPISVMEIARFFRPGTSLRKKEGQRYYYEVRKMIKSLEKDGAIKIGEKTRRVYLNK